MPESKDLKLTSQQNQNILAAILKKEMFDISYPDMCLLVLQFICSLYFYGLENTVTNFWTEFALNLP